MKPTEIVKLAEKFAAGFVRRMPSAAHIREELQQEAAIAILASIPRYQPGKMALTSFVYPTAYKAMQVYCARASGPVNRPADKNGHHGTVGASDGHAAAFQHDPMAKLAERIDASRTVDAFIAARVDRIGSKLPRETLTAMMRAVATGDNYLEVAERFGVSKQRVHQMTQAMGLADLIGARS